MSLLIAFSGGCHSGKSTTMTTVAGLLQSKGYEVEVFKENMHKHLADTTIEELRANPDKYYTVENRVISDRLDAEWDYLTDGKDRIVLIDRAITDNLFYLTNYINISQLRPDMLKSYTNLLQRIIGHAKATMPLTFLVEFKPLPQKCDDFSYRPKNIDDLKQFEYTMIHAYNLAFKSVIDKVPTVYMDLNKPETVIDLVKRITKFYDGNK